MKIAILTLPLHTNYGGILQAYALQTILERMGHTVEVLQHKPTRTHPRLIMPLVYAKRIAYKFFKDWSTPILIEQKETHNNKIIRQHTNRFIQRYIHIREIKDLNEISQNEYGGIIVGSDQIWRKEYFRAMWKSPIKNAFLAFTKNWEIKRISYAASFGLANLSGYSDLEIISCRKALNHFDRISVREASGIEICRNKLCANAELVLDPTMLLEKDDYENIIATESIDKVSGDIMLYILDPSPFKDQIIEKTVNLIEGRPFNAFAETGNRKIPVQNRIQPPVEFWLRGFMDAKIIVTDSFHACVFSIIFNKPFIVLGNSNRGNTRLNSLLSMYSLQDRLILSMEDFDKIADNIMELALYDNQMRKNLSLKFIYDAINE